MEFFQQNEPMLSPETSPPRAKIILNFLRHGQAEAFDVSRISSKKTGDQVDHERQLTQQGIHESISRGQEIELDAATSVSFSSGRERADQSAALAIATALGEDIDSGDSEAGRLVSSDKRKASKLATDKNLDFSIGPETPDGLSYMGMLYKAIGENRFIDFLVTDSGNLTADLGIEATTYKSASKQVAKIIGKYFTILPRFEGLVSQGKTNELDEMQRIMGTHQGLTECFIIMLTEQKEGREKAQELARRFGNGFANAAGPTVSISADENGEPTASLSYSYPEYGEISINKSDLEEILSS